MSFASWQFTVLFLPAVLLVFTVLGSHDNGTRRMWLLIAASILFYSTSGLGNASVVAASIAVNYAAGLALVKPDRAKRQRKTILWAAVVINLVILMGFKIAALDTTGGEGFSATEQIYIPLALSFVTFQQIGFVAACYRRQIVHVTPARYLFFVTFFPQLIMGPIVRFEDIDRQLESGALAHQRCDDVIVGLAIFALALAKKLMVAEPLSVPVDSIFATARHSPIGAGDAWFAIIGFQLQLYFDFTAYAEMAIGIGRMFGIALPINFDRPLFATNRFDLWRRWHISFVMFMRTNVFLPLVRHWRLPIPAALAVTGMLSGLWHGLGWTFIVWGLIQTALLLTVHYRNTRNRRTATPTARETIWLIASTFLVSALVGAMFRAPTLTSAQHVYGGLVGSGGWSAAQVSPFALAMLAIAALLVWGLPDLAQIFRNHWTAIDMRPDGKPQPVHWIEKRLGFFVGRRWAMVTAFCIVISIVVAGDSQRFVYAQF